MTNDCDDISALFAKSLSNQNELQASNAIYLVTTMTSSSGMQRTHVNDYKSTANDS